MDNQAAGRAAAADDHAWLRDQVARYRRVHRRYRRYADVLAVVLRAAAVEIAPLAIVQTRPKSIASFAEKAIRKRDRYHDALAQLTDLCGGRVIVRTRHEVEAFSEFLKDRFAIDWENSVDHVRRLEPTEFGYRSAHYIVAFRDGTEYGVSVPSSVLGLKAEVQVRTIAEHAWADLAHDLSYKGALALPRAWLREIAILSAKLEDVDLGFGRIEDSLRRYAATYGAYLTDEQAVDEMRMLDAVLSQDPTNAGVGWRLGHLAIARGDWTRAVDVLGRFVDPENPSAARQPVLRDLGVALCKLHQSRPTLPEYRRGQRYLELASQPQHRDPDALASLAGSWRGIDEERSQELYRRAFELDPTDAYPLGNVVDEWAKVGDSASLHLLRPLLLPAIERARAQAAAGVNIPWAHYGIGRLELLRGETSSSLRGYARAVATSTAPFMLEGSLDSIERLVRLAGALPALDQARLLLTLGLAAKFPSRRATARVRAIIGPRSTRRRLTGAVAIVAGSTDAETLYDPQAAHELLLEGFADFAGTVVSGGTRSGVSGMVGALSTAGQTRIVTIGYAPRGLPATQLDRRYTQIRRTPGRSFSALQPLFAWADLLQDGISPREVTVLGIGGGEISAIEYRVALALGARVCVVEGFGGESARLLADPDWTGAAGLVAIPADGPTLRAVLGSAALDLDGAALETIARGVHDAYRQEGTAAHAGDDPTLRGWPELSEEMRESNRHHASHIAAKLREIGCTVVRPTGRPPSLMTFTDDEIETMARLEHGRWNAERLLGGWVIGERRNARRRESPYFVPWSALPEHIRELDRAMVRRIPDLLAGVGLEVRRNRQATTPL